MPVKLAVKMRKTCWHPQRYKLYNLLRHPCHFASSCNANFQHHNRLVESPQHQSHPLSHPVPNRCPNLERAARPTQRPHQSPGRDPRKESCTPVPGGMLTHLVCNQPHPAICNSGEKQTTFVRDRDYRIERLGSGKRGNKQRRLEVSRGIDAQA